jgi:hypothetical protein
MIVACVLVASASVTYGQRAKRTVAPAAFQCTRQIVANDWRTLLNDLRTINADLVKRIESDAEYRKTQEENLRQLFAFACQAVAEGVVKDPVNRAELDYIGAEIAAVQYDKAAHNDADRFSSIGEERINSFYNLAGNNVKFDAFLKTKLELHKRSNPDMADRVITAEEREQAKINFAQISLSVADSKLRGRPLSPALTALTALQTKLQQAQFLSRLYAEKVAEETQVTDDEIDRYISAHPEFDTTAKRSRAQAILDRALAGEDFAALADQFTEDPGNNGPDGKSGGLYQSVPKGQMVPEFEEAALALEPGQVAPQLVNTAFGFHVMKLERKGWIPDETYDVRHILITTTVKDPANPNGRETPVRDFVRIKLESEKESVILAKVVADNRIDIAPVPVGPAVAEKQPVKRRRARNK